MSSKRDWRKAKRYRDADVIPRGLYHPEIDGPRRPLLRRIRVKDGVDSAGLVVALYKRRNALRPRERDFIDRQWNELQGFWRGLTEKQWDWALDIAWALEIGPSP